MVQPPRALWRPGPPAAVALLLALLVAVSPSTTHARSARAKAGARRAGKRAAPRPKIVPKIVPNQEGKIVVFPIKEDDDHAISAQVERLLRSRGLEVVTGVRPVDTAEQYREMATHLGVVAYVDGTFREGERSSRVTVQVRSGYSGRRVAATTFKESNLHLHAEIEDKLWTKLGPAIGRACADAAKPRKRGRGPLLIEAGTPLASTDSAAADDANHDDRRK